MDNDIKNFDVNFFEAKIEKIIPPTETEPTAIYVLSIADSFGKKWNKAVTLNELKAFRLYLYTYVPIIESYPFPTVSWMTYLPFIGKKYSEYNWDVLIEYKFILDDFLKVVCKNSEVYKLSEFEKFFKLEPKNNDRATSFTFTRA